jgi:glc operon protein GlcG
MSFVATSPTQVVSSASAAALVQRAIFEAVAAGFAASVVVADPAGELVAAGRADGASVLSLEVAARKAWTAANTSVSTADLGSLVASDKDAIVYMQSIPRFVAIPGGLPLRVDGHCVGAIGVSGGSSAQDAEVAAAALRAIKS